MRWRASPPRLRARHRPGAGGDLPLRVSARGSGQRVAGLPDPRRRAGPDRVPERGAHRRPRRGGARQDRLRPLLRAHDVPRHEEVPQLRRHHREAGGVPQRQHQQRPHRVLHGGGHRVSRADHGPGVGPVHEPRLLGGRDSAPRRAPSWASTSRAPTAPTPCWTGPSARRRSSSTPTATPPSAWRPTSAGCPRGTSTPGASSTGSTGRRTWCWSSSGTSTSTETEAMVHQYYDEWAPGYQAPAIPAEPEQTAKRTASVTYRGRTLPMVSYNWKAPGVEPHRQDGGGHRGAGAGGVRPQLGHLPEAGHPGAAAAGAGRRVRAGP